MGVLWLFQYTADNPYIIIIYLIVFKNAILDIVYMLHDLDTSKRGEVDPFCAQVRSRLAGIENFFYTIYDDFICSSRDLSLRLIEFSRLGSVG